MSFQAMLAARAHVEGRAKPTAMLRHRALAANPLCIVAWQLGQEPFSVGAIAMGTKSSGFKLYVPGYPLDRELLFAALTRLAKQFCPAFEAYGRGATESIEHFDRVLQVPKALPQIVVANAETVGLLGRLGRRLAYLPTDGEHPADPALPRMGRHLLWLARHAHLPGQQLIVSAADLLNSHYMTPMSAYEAGSLAAIDAWIAPPPGMHGFTAAEAAERQAVGPTPDPEDAERIYKAMMEFNSTRRRSRDPALVRRLAKPLRDIYEVMVEDTWNLIWKVIDREKARPEAASVVRRALKDRIEYTSHLEWMEGRGEGRLKTRQDPRAAAMRLNDYERTDSVLAAEEAIDDPLRMAPNLLAGRAIAGEVVRSEPDRRELINGRATRRPSITLRTEEPCVMPIGTELWWTEVPKGREWVIEEIATSGNRSDVTLILQTNRMPDPGLPDLRNRVCFSQLNTRDPYEVHLPHRIPWTHRPKERPPVETELESGDNATETA